MAGKVDAKRGGKAKPSPKRRRKTPPRKHAPRKQGKAREYKKRKKLLLGGPPPSNTFEAPERPTRPRDSGADDDEDFEEFTGPIGDSYDADFADIDWDDVDFDDIIDDIGEELLDSYSED